MNTLWSNTTYQIHVNVSSMLNDYLISPHYFLTCAFNIFCCNYATCISQTITAQKKNALAHHTKCEKY